MDIVADRRAVPRRIIGAEDVQRIAATERGAQDERDKVGFGIVIFADLAIRIGAGGIEIAQGGVAQSMRAAVPVQCALDRQLGIAIRVERALWRSSRGSGRFLESRTLRKSRRIQSSRPRPRASRRAATACRQRCCDNKAGGRHRFADIGERCEMHDRFDPVRAHRRSQPVAIV